MKNFLFLLVFLLSLGVLLGNSSILQAAPMIVSMNPPDSSTTVPLNTNLTFAYDEVMDTETFISDSFTLSYDVEGTPTFVTGVFSYSDNGSVIRFAPGLDPETGSKTNLEPSTYYQGTITTGVTNIYGTPTATTFGFSFTTGTDTDMVNDCVWYTDPYDDDTEISVGSEYIYVIFNERQDALTINTNTIILSNNYGNVSGQVGYYDYGEGWAGTPTAVFFPDNNLEYYTTYTITASSNILDMSGNMMPGTFTSSFTTESAPPAPVPYVPPVTKFYVTETSPKNEEETSDARCPITVKFNINVDTDWSLNNPFSFYDEDGNSLKIDGAYSGFYEEGGGKKIIFTPSEDWPEGKMKVAVSQKLVRAANRAGTLMEKDYEFSFSVLYDISVETELGGYGSDKSE